MPYYQRSWNVSLGQSGGSGKNVRTGPALAGTKSDKGDTAEAGKAAVPVDQAKVTSMQATLTEHVTKLTAFNGAQPIKQTGNYLNYAVRKDQVIFSGEHSEIYGCTNADYGSQVLIAREFYPSSLIDPDKDLYLKVLRYIGVRGPSIIQTMDVFVDQNRHIFLFQEYANRGNALEWVRAGSELDEAHLHKWAHTIYDAIDFLGSIGVSHRSIHPKHLLLHSFTGADLEVKLAGFRDAVVYWDPERKHIIDQPVKPLDTLKFAYFQAPESLGSEGEFFDPLQADVWSYGASLFYVCSRLCPFNLKAPEPDMEAEIKRTVFGVDKLSDGAKTWLYGLVRPFTAHRTQFDQIAKDPWFAGGAGPGGTASNSSSPVSL